MKLPDARSLLARLRCSRWTKVVLLAALPLALYLAARERASWRPRTLEHRGKVEYVAFSPDGNTLFTGDEWQQSMEGMFSGLWLWDVKARRPVWNRVSNGARRGLAFAPDGRTMALADWNSAQLKLWDIRTRKPVRTLRPLELRAVDNLVFSPDSKLLAAPGGETLSRLWDVTNPEPQPLLLKASGLGTGAAAFSPDGRTLAIGNTLERHSQLSLFDVATGKLRRNLWQSILPSSITYFPDGKTLVVGGIDGAVRLCDNQTGKVSRTLTGHSTRVSCVTFSPDGATLASASEDRTVKLWDVPSGTLQRTLIGHKSTVDSVDISPDGATLASGSADGTVKLWRIK